MTTKRTEYATSFPREAEDGRWFVTLWRNDRYRIAYAPTLGAAKIIGCRWMHRGWTWTPRAERRGLAFLAGGL